MSSESGLVRLATGDDLASILEVGRRTWPATYESIYDEELVQLILNRWWTSEAVSPLIRSERTFVAEADGGVVGVASYGPHEGRMVLWRLYVLPEYQNRHLGTGLLNHVMDAARWSSSRLHLSLSDGNAAAYDFARQFGFEEEFRESQGDLPDIIWMCRPLESHLDFSDLGGDIRTGAR